MQDRSFLLESQFQVAQSAKPKSNVYKAILHILIILRILLKKRRSFPAQRAPVAELFDFLARTQPHMLGITGPLIGLEKPDIPRSFFSE